MRCHRCDGLMVQEQFEEVMLSAGESEFTGWRCLNCAAVVDPVIVANRRRTNEAVVASYERPAYQAGLIGV